MRIVGLDVSRSVAEIAHLEDDVLHAGRSCRTKTRRIGALCRKIAQHRSCGARSDSQYRRHRTFCARVARVAIANPLLVRLIAEAQIKTVKIDTSVLPRLYASNFLPEVWMPAESTLALCRQVLCRSQPVQQRTRLKAKTMRCWLPT